MKSAPYRIDSAGLTLRCWEPADLSAFDQAIRRNIEHLRPWMCWIQYEPATIDARLAVLRGFRAAFDLDQDYTYGIFAADGHSVVGGCGLHRRAGPHALEIGYWIDRDRLNRGHATAVARTLTAVGFAIDGIDRIEIRHDEHNDLSRRIPDKLGFTNEGTRRQVDYSFPDRARNMTTWTMLKSEHRTDAFPGPAACYDCAGRAVAL